jgi:hypothetical protein
MNLRLLVSGLCAWPLEQAGVVEVGVCEAVAIVSQH